MSASGNNGFVGSLETLAQDCAEEVCVTELARVVTHQLFELSDTRFAGISVFDEERQTVRLLHGMRPTDSGGDASETVIRDEEMPAELTELPFFLEKCGPFTISAHTHDPGALRGRLRDSGVSQYLSVPIKLRDRLLGSVFLGLAGSCEIPADLADFASRLAKVITPVLYNCLNHERFARGDRRRDALVELSKAINSSLDLDTVIKHARRVIGSLEGHRTSAILLLSASNETFRLFETFRQTETDRLSMPGPTVHRVKSSVMAWLLEHGATYESDDLEEGTHYENEHEYRKRGVRRYLTLPLLARGRILGGFVFGTGDPKPKRKVEYWLYENIALQLALALDNAQKHEQLRRLTNQLAGQNDYLRSEIQTEQGFGEMIGATPAMTALRAEISRVAPTDAAVLITGETGVGKELVARFIHEASPRSKQPLIKVNCPGIPETMFESELFGHERGAFTSAIEKRVGRFELAAGGTLFLDEIGELSLAVQAKLLRVLQDGEFERVGGSKTLTSNARIIAATNRDLSKAVDDGRFRADLFFRLNVFPIHVPPLRDRRADIPAITQAFVAEFAKKSGKRIERVDEDDLKNLQHRRWPGNIRELRHHVERAVILCDDSVLRVSSDGSNPDDVSGDAETTSRLDVVQADEICRVLGECEWVIEGVNGAAAALGLKPSTLRFRMKRLGIKRSNAAG